MRSFDLNSYLPYLVNRLGAKLVANFQADCARHKIDIRMWRVLAALNHHNGQKISALAAMTSIDISTLSRLLMQMERRKLVSRTRSFRDQRAVLIRRTAVAREITQALLPVAAQLEKRALGKIYPLDADRLKDFLVEVYRNLD